MAVNTSMIATIAIIHQSFGADGAAVRVCTVTIKLMFDNSGESQIPFPCCAVAVLGK